MPIRNLQSLHVISIGTCTAAVHPKQQCSHFTRDVHRNIQPKKSNLWTYLRGVLGRGLLLACHVRVATLRIPCVVPIALASRMRPQTSSRVTSTTAQK